MRLRSDTSIIMLFCLALAMYNLVSATVVRARQHKLGYICAQQGEVLIDNGMDGPAKCWNPHTTLMHEPEELLRLR